MHRREIALALARPEVTVVPVLVDGASMPKAEELPENIRELIQQQSRAISDNAAHRKVDMDALSADIRRVGRFSPKPEETTKTNTNSTQVLVPLKNSGKAIGAISLAVMVFLAAAAEGGLDHDTKVAGFVFGAIGLWLGWSGFKEIKTAWAKGRGLALPAIGLSCLATVGMLGALTQPEAVKQPNANSMTPAMSNPAPVINPAPQPPILSEPGRAHRQTNQTGAARKTGQGRESGGGKF